MYTNVPTGSAANGDPTYLVEGPSGQMYGPADASIIQEWFAEGRIAMATPLIEQATGNRITVSQVPGFVPSSLPNWVSPPIADPTPQKSSTPTWIIYAALALFAFLFYAAVVVPKVSNGRGIAKTAAAKSDLSVISNAIQEFRLDCGRYPTSAEGLDALRDYPTDAPGWKGPYLTKEVPRDPWANPYVYRVPGPNGTGFVVESYGADGRPGGEDEDSDIVVAG